MNAELRAKMRKAIDDIAISLAGHRNIPKIEALKSMQRTYEQALQTALGQRKEEDYWRLMLQITDEELSTLESARERGA